MGLFSRKNSKSPNPNGDFSEKSSPSLSSIKDERQPSVKTFTPMNGHPMSPAPIPHVDIPKPPDPAIDPAAYLRSIHAVRERSQLVYEKAKRNRLNHFDVDLSKFADTAAYVVSIIKVSSFWAMKSFNTVTDLCPARLCTRLQINTPAWAMATFRCRWETKNQPVARVMA